MRRGWLLALAPVAFAALGSGPPSTLGVNAGASDPERTLPTITSVDCTPSIATLSEANEPLTITCDVHHNGYAGNLRLGIACGDGLAAGEFNHDLSAFSKGQRIDATTTRFTTNMCTRDHWSTAGTKTIQVEVYAGNAQSAVSCTSEGAGETKPQCSDGIDNDGDTAIDYPADPNCLNENGTSEGGGCGIGFELIFITPLLRTLARRRTR